MLSNPVIPLGTGTDLDRGRILEPSVLYDTDAGIWKMWYSGIPTNGGGFNQGWKTFYATSSDGITWGKQGIVMSNAWEADVIKVGAVYYMSYVMDTSPTVRIATSSDGKAWVDRGISIPSYISTWGTVGSREPSLFYENGLTYCYYSDQDSSGQFKTSIAFNKINPLVLTSWNSFCWPTFWSGVSGSGLWNDSGFTECPYVRKYVDLPHPYLMTFINYHVADLIANKPWRPGLAYADTPFGPWKEAPINPFLVPNSTWANNIVGEIAHAQNGDSIYFYFAGGVSTGSNQIGLATMTIAELAQLQHDWD